jgi:protein involved in polysaccharide export with SLBB domain
METMKLLRRGMTGLGLILACILLAGCQSDKNAAKQSGPYTFDPLNEDVSANSGLPGSGSSHGAGGSVIDTNGSGTAILQAGDILSVVLNDVNPAPQAIEDQIKEDGTITLYFNEPFHAAGKTVRELQAEIHARYVPKYYKMMTPSVKTADRFFSVGGEIKAPNRYVWTPGMTVLRAIDAASGFTDYSRKGRVIITRANSKLEYEDCIKALKHPELDLPIYPGDKVFVKKKIL